MSARRWDAEGAGAKVSAALVDIEESRAGRGETTKLRDFAVHVSDGGTVCVALIMSDGSVERVMFNAEAVALQ